MRRSRAAVSHEYPPQWRNWIDFIFASGAADFGLRSKPKLEAVEYCGDCRPQCRLSEGMDLGFLKIIAPGSRGVTCLTVLQLS